MQPESPSTEGGETGIYRRNTLIFFLVLTCIASTGVTAWYAPSDWSWLRVVAAGIVGGALCYLCVFVNHMLAFPVDA